MTDDMDARARVKRLEAECERLREQNERIGAMLEYFRGRIDSEIGEDQ